MLNSSALRTGDLLRQYSVDELPQLMSIIKGDMNLVGPRRVLLVGESLIKLRESLGVDQIRPGITWLAQVNGRDSPSTDEKVKSGVMYLKSPVSVCLFYNFIKVP